MSKTSVTIINAELMDEDYPFSLAQICRVCLISAEQVNDLVEQGVVDPAGSSPTQWRFSHRCITRMRRASRLQEDLGVNVAGAALALDLMQELEVLREKVRLLERLDQV